MIAVVFPRNNRIAVRASAKWILLGPDADFMEQISFSEFECNDALTNVEDSYSLHVESLEAARAELLAAMSELDALDLLLLSLDWTLSEATRRICLQEFVLLVSEDRVVRSLLSVMSGRPLPPDADVDGAINLCIATECSAVRLFLEQLRIRQPIIAIVRQSWDEIRDEFFESREERSRFEGASLHAGLFLSFTEAAGNSLSLKNLIETAQAVLAPYKFRRTFEILIQWSALVARHLSGIAPIEERELLSDPYKLDMYEGMFLVDSKRYAADPDAVQQSILGMLETVGANVVAERPWQEGKLCYPIEGMRKGLYYLVCFTMNSKLEFELNRLCKLNEVILRQLVLRHPKVIFDAMVDALTSDCGDGQVARIDDSISQTD